MSLNPSAGAGGSSGTQQTDYLGLLGNLSPLPFDPNTVINGLLAADQAPITNLQTQIKNVQTNESIYKNIGNDVAALQAAAFNLTLQTNVQANAVTSSNAGAVSATAGPGAQAGTYTVAVNHLATATAAASTAALGQTVDAAASTTPLSSLNLSGTPRAGTFSVVVDGKVQTVTVDPTKALLDPAGALSLLTMALTTGLNDGTAVVNVGVSGDKVSISISGASAQHTISFGAAGDTSNFLFLMNLSTAQGTTSGGALALASSSNVGVAQVNAPLSSAMLATPLTSSGSFTINGVSIAYDVNNDSLSSVINRINSSAAGVVAQYNGVTDQLVLTNKATGQTAMNLADASGNFLAAMNLAPGTTNAQTLGTNASLTVNGTPVTSPSNTITNAVPGLSITATAQTSPGTPATLTVAPDTAGITRQVQSFVDAANKVLSDIHLTQQKDPTSGTYSRLLGDPTLNGLVSTILTTITGRVTSSGAYQSLQDIGITTGRVGSLPGTTSTLTLDTARLAAAITANPQQVAALFNGITAVNGFQGVAQRLNTYLRQQTNPTRGPFAQYQAAGDAQIKSLQDRITQMNNMIAQQRKILVARFSAMSTALTNLASESTMFAASGGSSSSSGH